MTSRVSATPKARCKGLSPRRAPGAFDLQRGPLARGRLIRIGDRDHALVITLHHIVSDGWSMGVLTREMSALYARSPGDRHPLPGLAIQYADFAVWQRRWLYGAVLTEQPGFWHRQLAGAPPVLRLPIDRPRPSMQDSAGAAFPRGRPAAHRAWRR